MELLVQGHPPSLGGSDLTRVCMLSSKIFCRSASVKTRAASFIGVLSQEMSMNQLRSAASASSSALTEFRSWRHLEGGEERHLLRLCV
jgi:hypothetical protein